MFIFMTPQAVKRMDDVLNHLEKHYEAKYPGTEICIIIRKGVYRILSDGKVKETLNAYAIINNFKR